MTELDMNDQGTFLASPPLVIKKAREADFPTSPTAPASLLAELGNPMVPA
jgi:hypothetical protein